MTHTAELLPCPFCGSACEVKQSEKGQAGCFEDIFTVECYNCGCCRWDWHDTEAEAITAWNQRTDAQLRADRDALLEALEESQLALAAARAFIIKLTGAKNPHREGCMEVNAALIARIRGEG